MMRGSWRFGVVALVLACNPDAGCQDDSEAGDGEYGDACETSADCLGWLACAGDGVCRSHDEPGTYQVGDECVSSQYCEAGLVCSSAGVCAEVGDAGTAGLGEECATTEDCQLGYQCIDDACYGFPIPLWLGAECEPRGTDEGEFRAYFEVPGDEPLDEFYRLPFPNDARVVDGALDLSGHPTPGVLIPALGDVVGETLGVLVDDFDGFGTNQAVFFRFSQHAEFDDLAIGLPGEGTHGVVDVTPGSDSYGELHSIGWKASTAQRAYICSHWLAMGPNSGRPYTPGNTYVAYVTSDIPHNDGSSTLDQDDDFAAMVADEAPDDARLQHAYGVYEPLRLWLEHAEIDPDDLAAATVFTVQDPLAPLQALRAAALAATAPATSGLHLCVDGEAGPYADPDDADRGCDDVSGLFHEVQGLVSLPQFQQGIPPFKSLEDGGDIDPVSPTVERTDQVHFSLTVPKATMPADGWPLVLYGHGTSGNYRAPVLNNMARDLSLVSLDGGGEVHFAVLTIDAPVHGPRRHEENWDPTWLDLDPGAYDADVLFYNPINPRAARDNVLRARPTTGDWCAWPSRWS